MITPPIPENEAERLAALRRYRVLDTAPEPAFDDLARIVAFVCGTPTALVSLVDEKRQWFKARIGMDAQETPRDLAFCAHAVADTSRPLVVTDTLKDERFVDRPLVLDGPQIRFYAGAQLLTSDGFALGTLCAIDSSPRELTPLQIETLQALARQVVDQLELRRTVHRLHETVDELEGTTRQLEVARQEAVTLARVKSDFLAAMSHEIRTPLNGVLGMLTLVDDAALTGDFRDSVRTARESAELLLDLVDDLLDLSKAEAGRLVIEHEPFDLAALVQGVITMVSGSARERALTLEWHLADGVPGVVRGDSARVRQVLLNLVGNAVKFTERGGVTVHVRPGMGGTVVFDVHDTGIGIPRDRQRQVFEPFVQADSSTTRRFGGTGLGLSICRHLVTAMQGSLALESEEGKGSTFTVILPLPAEVQPAPVVSDDTTKADDVLRGLRVLVAEDNVVNQRVARRMLEKLGCTVTLVSDGRQAVERAGDGFDAILMDCRMPQMDGYEAATEIVETYPLAPPIIALTASALADERTRCLESGMVAFLTKPIRIEELASALVTYAAPGRAQPPTN